MGWFLESIFEIFIQSCWELDFVHHVRLNQFDRIAIRFLMSQFLCAVIHKFGKPKCIDQIGKVIKLMREDLNIFELGSMEIKTSFKYIRSHKFVKLEFRFC